MRPLFLLAVGLLLAGCDSTEIRPGVFDPFDTSRAYSVFAVLDATGDEHVIRVQTIRRESDPPLTEEEALRKAPRVVTVDNATGDSLVWNASTQRLADGSFAAIYRARFEPGALRSYELFLTRSDGTDAYGRAVVPEGERAPEVIDPAASEGDVVLGTRWNQFGALRAVSGVVSYRLDPAADRPSSFPVDLDYDLSPGAEPRVDVNFSEAARALRASRGLPADSPIYLYGIRVAVEGTSPGWLLTGGDPVLAAEQGNIEGAVGRFGFVDTGAYFVLPSADRIRLAGFTPAP